MNPRQGSGRIIADSTRQASSWADDTQHGLDMRLIQLAIANVLKRARGSAIRRREAGIGPNQGPGHTFAQEQFRFLNTLRWIARDLSTPGRTETLTIKQREMALGCLTQAQHAAHLAVTAQEPPKRALPMRPPPRKCKHGLTVSECEDEACR